MAERITRQVLDFQETLIAAGLQKGPERLVLLRKADIQLAQLRQNLRLCKDLDLFSIGQYEHASAMLVEIGRLLGGWQKVSVQTGQAM